MPRRKNTATAIISTDHNKSLVGGGAENSKIRKRGCYSSPSSSTTTNSSSLVQKKSNHRVKRAILVVGKRAGSSTPVPSWKMQDLMRSPTSGNSHNNNTNNHHHHGGGGEYCNTTATTTTNNNNQLSARRLGATLWEINGMKTKSQSSSPVVVGSGGGAVEDEEEEESRSLGKIGEMRRRRMYGTSNRHLMLDQTGSRSPAPGYALQDRSPVYEKKDGSNKATTGGHRRRSSVVSEKLQITGYLGVMDQSANDPATIEVVDTMTAAIDIKSRLKDVRNSLQTSKELVKVLLKMWGQEGERNSSRLTLVSALRVELGQARIHIDELIQNQREIETVIRQFAAEKSTWKRREHERIVESVSSVTRELEMERKLRKRAERMNKRLGRELGEAREEVISERRGREVLEQRCEDLARGVGEEVEVELRRVREEVEKEREMLQLADVLREERVQMKLTEARYEYEEKNEAVERLRNELEVHLGVNKVDEGRDCEDDDVEEVSEVVMERNGGGGGVSEFLSKLRKGTSFLRGKRHQHEGKKEGEVENEDVESDDDDDDSELHSIELNNNMEEKLKWSSRFDSGKEEAAAAVAGLLRNDSRPRASVEEVFRGRRSLSEKIQWESICLQRKTSADEMSSKLKQQQVIMNGRLSPSSQRPSSSSKGRKDRALMRVSSSTSSKLGEVMSPPASPFADSGKRQHNNSNVTETGDPFGD